MAESINESLEKLGIAFVPKRWRPNIRSYLMKAGYDEVPYKYFGVLFLAGALISAALYLFFIFNRVSHYHIILVFLLTFLSWAGIQFFVTGGIITTIYFYLNIKIYKRTKELEEKLADYLTLVSTNLKGGLSFEKSLWTAIKPEFGILAREITIVSKKVMTGNDVTEAMVEFSKKYDSPILRRSVNLVIGEIESGGKIADVIDRVVATLRKTRNLKEEMAAATVSYMIFIAVIVVVIAPGLFALSYQLLKIIIGFTSSLSSVSMGGGMGGPMAGGISQVSVKPSHFRIFTFAALGTVAVCSSFIISIIERGDVRGGLKYTLAFIMGSWVFYWFFGFILGKLFSGLAFGG